MKLQINIVTCNQLKWNLEFILLRAMNAKVREGGNCKG